ncbi:TonB-dependent receptor domain-containing protein [Croceicoccus sp. BE223]|uniref:TonB-dependent receptor n=1 Tax=Croceicoccus sp. BE223 TaxID=2817716 RepID=UPI0028590D5B|nr:TonB-dependent receptor [Croceicoccus sp. BE223]MDR7103744.1 iron complex outermembrane receptor protein [Croceicoccus sp. BE223]
MSDFATLKCLIGTSSLAFVLAAQSAFAQDSDVDADVQETGGLGEIVVTAQKRSQSLQEVPVSINVVSGDQIARSNISDTSLLGQIAPSITFTSGFGPVATSFNIRGVGTYVSEVGVQPAVSVVVDGIPLARNAEFFGELGAVERLEVLNGPQGTLFGRNATGGLINVVRARPTNDFEGSADASIMFGKRGGTEMLTRMAISGPLNDSVRGRLSTYVKDRSNFVKNYALNGVDHGEENVFGLVGKLEVDLTQDVQLLVTGEASRYRGRTATSSVLIPIQPGMQPLIPDVTARQTALLGAALGDLFSMNRNDTGNISNDIYGISGELTWDLGGGLSLYSVTGYRDVTSRSHPDVDNTIAGAGETYGWDIISINTNANTLKNPRRPVYWDYLTHETRLEYSGAMVDIVGGLFYQDFEESLINAVPLLLSARSLGRAAAVDTPSGPSSDYPYYYSDTATTPTNSNKTVAGFLDATLHATDALDIFAGIRVSREKLSYTYDSATWFIPVQCGVTFDCDTYSPISSPNSTKSFSGSKTSTEWSGRAGVRYEIQPDVSIYATASRGYVGAGVDLSRATAGTASNPQGALLAPSFARNFEVGLKAQLFDNRLRLNAAVFDLLVKDLQAQSLIPGTVSNRVQNAGNLKTRGVELSGEVYVSDSLELNGAFSYLDSEFDNFSTTCYYQQTAQEGCVGSIQVIDGKPGLNAPKVKFNVGADFHTDINAAGAQFYFRPRYNYQSKVWYTLDHDPELTQKGYGIFDTSVGIVTADENLDFSLFVRNMFNTSYCNSKLIATIIGRSFCQGVSFDAQRLIGGAVRAKF